MERAAVMINQADTPLLVSADEAAAMCGVSRATWFNWQATGQIPRPCLAKGRIRRWSRQTIERWIDAGCPPRDRWREGGRQ